MGIVIIIIGVVVVLVALALALGVLPRPRPVAELPRVIAQLPGVAQLRRAIPQLPRAVINRRRPRELRGDWWSEFERQFREYACRVSETEKPRRRPPGEAKPRTTNLPPGSDTTG